MQIATLQEMSVNNMEKSYPLKFKLATTIGSDMYLLGGHGGVLPK